jgi:hypothetical protein
MVALTVTTTAFLAEIVRVNLISPGTFLADAFITVRRSVIGINFCFTKSAYSCVSSIRAGHKQLLQLSLLKFFWVKASIYVYTDFLAV